MIHGTRGQPNALPGPSLIRSRGGLFLAMAFAFAFVGILSSGIYSSLNANRPDELVKANRQSRIALKIGKFEFTRTSPPKEVDELVQPKPTGSYLRIVGGVSGALALVAAAAAAASTKRYKAALIAAVLGIVCLAWEFIMVGIGTAVTVAVCIILLVAVLSLLGF